MNFKVIGVSILSICASMEAFSQSYERFEISTSKLDQLVDYSKTEFDRAKIDALNPSSTLDLLKKIPHIVISENGQAGGFSYVSIRGGESNFTLILIDGIPVSDPTNSRGGGFDFNQLDPNVIERVEVYRGGVSSIYGNGAVSGVIQFITRRDAATSVRVEAGNQDQFNTGVSFYTDLSDQVSALFSASTRQQKAPDNAEYENNQVLAKINAQTQQSQHSLLLSFSDQKASGFPEDSGGELFAALPSLEKRDSEQLLAGLRSEIQYADNMTLHSNISWQRHEETSDHPGILQGALSGVPASLIDSEYTNLEADIYVTSNINASWKILGGINARRSKGSNQGSLDFGFPVPVDYAIEQKTYGAFVETSFQQDNLSIDLGARYDDPTEFSGEWSLRSNLAWQLNDSNLLYAAYNEGYKLPSFFALAHPLIGNLDLKPERSKNWEVGLQQSTTVDSQLEILGFYNEFSDLVDFDPEQFTSINRSAVDSYGLELNYSTTLTTWLSLDADVSYIKTDIKDSEDELRRRPRWVAGIAATTQWNDLSVTLNIDTRSEFTDSSIPTGVTTLGGFTVASLAGNWSLNENLNLSVNLDNILSKSYQESIGFLNDDIKWRTGISYTF